MFLSLAYFKLERKARGFQHILNYISSTRFVESLISFISYFRLYYIGCSQRNAVYSQDFWDVSERIVLNIPRTTNTIEGWHRALNVLASVRHPNIGRFIHVLQVETEKTRVHVARTLNGNLTQLRKDYEKEFKLLMIIENQKFLIR